MRSQTMNLRGEQGGEYISDTAVHTPPAGTSNWVCALAVTTCVVSTITQPRFDNTLALAGATINAGQAIFGPITSITLGSGIMQMFNFVNPAKVDA